MKLYTRIAIALTVLLAFTALAGAQSWTPLNNQPGANVSQDTIRFFTTFHYVLHWFNPRAQRIVTCRNLPVHPPQPDRNWFSDRLTRDHIVGQ